MKRPRSNKKDRPNVPPWLKNRTCPRKKEYLSGKRIRPKAITGKESLSDILEDTFWAYNSARLKEACRLFTEKMLGSKVTVGMSLAGALTPAGLGISCVVPLIKAGFVDWIVSTGANMYHDLHFAFNFALHSGSPFFDDPDLRKNDIIRIYDVFLGYSDCLLATDKVLMSIIKQPEFQKEMGTAEFHRLLGKYAYERARKNRMKDTSILSAAYKYGVPIYTSSPGDSTIGMLIAAAETEGGRLRINPSCDVNETTAIVLAAKRSSGKSGVLFIGGGSPKNFILQTEPQIQEVYFIKEVGHDYYIQFTDARPDTGGLSGSTPAEAITWGKVNPDSLESTIVCYVDTTIALPMMTHYALANHKKRPLKNLYAKRDKMVSDLINASRKAHKAKK